MTGEYRQPVPDDEWQKFSAQHEAGVEAERTQIRSEEKQPATGQEPWVKGRRPTAEEKARLNEHMALTLEPAPKPGTPEANEQLLASVESGELTYEQLDEMALKTYQETPISERNWRRDAGFYQLSREEQQQEIAQEAIRDTMALSETLRAMSFSDPAKQRRLRNLLAEMISELQNEGQ